IPTPRERTPQLRWWWRTVTRKLPQWNSNSTASSIQSSTQRITSSTISTTSRTQLTPTSTPQHPPAPPTQLLRLPVCRAAYTAHLSAPQAHSEISIVPDFSRYSPPPEGSNFTSEMSQNTKNIRLLSLDGGGVRGLASLIILQNVFHVLNS